MNSQVLTSRKSQNHQRSIRRDTRSCDVDLGGYIRAYDDEKKIIRYSFQEIDWVIFILSSTIGFVIFFLLDRTKCHIESLLCAMHFMSLSHTVWMFRSQQHNQWWCQMQFYDNFIRFSFAVNFRDVKTTKVLLIIRLSWSPRNCFALYKMYRSVYLQCILAKRNINIVPCILILK